MQLLFLFCFYAVCLLCRLPKAYLLFFYVVNQAEGLHLQRKVLRDPRLLRVPQQRFVVVVISSIFAFMPLLFSVCFYAVNAVAFSFMQLSLLLLLLLSCS